MASSTHLFLHDPAHLPFRQWTCRHLLFRSVVLDRIVPHLIMTPHHSTIDRIAPTMRPHHHPLPQCRLLSAKCRNTTCMHPPEASSPPVHCLLPSVLLEMELQYLGVKCERERGVQRLGWWRSTCCSPAAVNALLCVSACHPEKRVQHLRFASMPTSMGLMPGNADASSCGTRAGRSMVGGLHMAASFCMSWKTHGYRVAQPRPSAEPGRTRNHAPCTAAVPLQ